jgi:hypothetical protein
MCTASARSTTPRVCNCLDVLLMTDALCLTLNPCNEMQYHEILLNLIFDVHNADMAMCLPYLY